jgi:hypothetical protein
MGSSLRLAVAGRAGTSGARVCQDDAAAPKAQLHARYRSLTYATHQSASLSELRRSTNVLGCSLSLSITTCRRRSSSGLGRSPSPRLVRSGNSIRGSVDIGSRSYHELGYLSSFATALQQSAVLFRMIEGAMNRLLIALGTVFVIAGVLWPWLKRVPLLHLPGDIFIDRPGFKFIFPITTLLIVSAVLSLLAWLMRR